MKRDGYVIPEIVVQSNLEESFDTVVRGTHRKSLAEGKWLIAHREDFLQSVKTEILSGAIQLRGFHEKTIREGGKTRRIEVMDYETDVETKNGLRTLVCYRDTRTNEMSKFFTASEEMTENLKAAKELGELPFSTVIGMECFGENKVKYKFT